MLKLPPANYLAFTDTLYTALNNVRAYLFRFRANSLPQIVLNCLVYQNKPSIVTKSIEKKLKLKIKLNFFEVKFVIFSKKLLCKVSIFFIDRLASTKAYQKNKKKMGVVI
jgi:hypothetical protein